MSDYKEAIERMSAHLLGAFEGGKEKTDIARMAAALEGLMPKLEEFVAARQDAASGGWYQACVRITGMLVAAGVKGAEGVAEAVQTIIQQRDSALQHAADLEACLQQFLKADSDALVEMETIVPSFKPAPEMTAMHEKATGVIAESSSFRRSLVQSDETVFEREYMGLPTKPDGREVELRKLAEEYVMRTEGFDRAHCTGPVILGAVMPACAEENEKSSSNAMQILQDMKPRLASIGFRVNDMMDVANAMPADFYENNLAAWLREHGDAGHGT